MFLGGSSVVSLLLKILGPKFSLENFLTRNRPEIFRSPFFVRGLIPEELGHGWKNYIAIDTLGSRVPICKVYFAWRLLVRPLWETLSDARANFQWHVPQISGHLFLDFFETSSLHHYMMEVDWASTNWSTILGEVDKHYALLWLGQRLTFCKNNRWVENITLPVSMCCRFKTPKIRILKKFFRILKTFPGTIGAVTVHEKQAQGPQPPLQSIWLLELRVKKSVFSPLLEPYFGPKSSLKRPFWPFSTWNCNCLNSTVRIEYFHIDGVDV